jgi:hypothetical protein
MGLEVRGGVYVTTARKKNVQIDVGDRSGSTARGLASLGPAHNLSARMGLEVRGAMMNTPQQKDIPNVG